MSTENNFHKKQGFTLIEILITVSLVAMVSLAIYKSLSVGIDVWKRSSKYVAEEDIAIFFDKITRDLNNTFQFSGISLSGDTSSFAFPTIINTLKDRKINNAADTYWNQVGKVEYFFDKAKKQLFRRQANYSQAVNGTFGEPRALASSIKRLRFHYYYLTEDGEVFSDTLSGAMPLGVEIDVAFGGEKADKVISKYINIPMGVY